MSIPYLNGQYLLPFIVNGKMVKQIYVNGRRENIDQPMNFTDPVAQQVCVDHFGINGHISFNLAQKVYSFGNWFKNRTDLVTFTELQGFNNLQTLGDDCFNGCTSLTAIKLPSRVSTILPRCFKDCSSLASDLWIPNVGVVNQEAFRGCTSLKKVDLGSRVGYIHSLAFAYCDALEQLIIRTETPPTIASDILQNSPNCNVYVYSRCINRYKAATLWAQYKDRILTID